MRHALLSGYIDEFTSSCAKKFEHFSLKRDEDLTSMLEAVSNSTKPLEKVYILIFQNLN